MTDMMNKAFLNKEENVTMFMANYLLSLNKTSVEQHCVSEMRKLRSDLEQYKEREVDLMQNNDLLNRRVEALERANGIKGSSNVQLHFPMISIPAGETNTTKSASTFSNCLDSVHHQIPKQSTSSSQFSVATKPEPVSPVIVNLQPKQSLCLSEDSEDSMEDNDETPNHVKSILQRDESSNPKFVEEIRRQKGQEKDDLTPIAMELEECIQVEHAMIRDEEAAAKVIKKKDHLAPIAVELKKSSEKTAIKIHSPQRSSEMSEKDQEKNAAGATGVMSLIKSLEELHDQTISDANLKNPEKSKKAVVLPSEIEFNEAQLSSPLKVFLTGGVGLSFLAGESNSSEDLSDSVSEGMIIDEKPFSLKFQTSKQIEDAINSLGTTSYDPDDFEESLIDFMEQPTELETEKSVVNSIPFSTEPIDQIELQLIALESSPLLEESEVILPSAQEVAKPQVEPVTSSILMNEDEFVPDYEEDDL